jgi:hypothetical protein
MHACAWIRLKGLLVTTSPQPPPEAQLIARLRQAHIPHLSMREAARRAGMSASLWTQYEQGYRKVTAAVTIPIEATDDKLAAMALVVGGAPEQLRQAGRDKAAIILQKLIDAGPDEHSQMAEAVRVSRDFTERQKQALIEMIGRARDSTP